MKAKYFLGILSIMGSFGISNADITVKLPSDCSVKSIAYYYAPIKQYASAKTRAERGMVTDSVAVENSKALIAIPTTADSYLFGLNLDDNNMGLYVVPGENINVDVTSCNPFSYTMNGSALIEGMNQLNALEIPLMEKAQQLNATGQGNSEEMENLSQQYLAVQKNFISENPQNPAAFVALMNLNGEDFLSLYGNLEQTQSNSILMPLAQLQYEREKKAIELEKKQQALQSGNVEAPNFTLKDLEGKDVSLSDFKGKWVILDFWGSWCPWCIKGFPELKEAYEKYAGTLEIIGIDCNEGEAEWRAGVEKYQLPWVNVYNPQGTSVLSEYGVQGFPTKAIINPEGKIANITVGHDPQFYVVLTELMGE